VASHAVMNGVPVPVVSRLLGHSQARMTLRYAHVSDRETEAAAERIGCAIAVLLAAQGPAPADRRASPVRSPVGEQAASPAGSASPPQHGAGTGPQGSGRAGSASGTDVRPFAPKKDLRSIHVTRLRAKNQLTLPASVVSAVGLKPGDVLHVATDQDRVIIIAQELRDRGRTYTMSELLGAASGLYDSVSEIDAEVAAGRDE
jgi:bifunctional DNA-binding transcriptional regulator/antitoxin component of YhaV-PrlF toxin-antitoxin module